MPNVGALLLLNYGCEPSAHRPGGFQVSFPKPTMSYRVYLRDPHQMVSHKTTTNDRDAALAAFAALVQRSDLDGRSLLAVLNHHGRPVAHHDFRLRPDGSPHDPAKYWRGKLDDIRWPSVAL